MKSRPFAAFLALSLAVAPIALAQPDQTYRPPRKNEPRQNEQPRDPQRTQREEARELFQPGARRDAAPAQSQWSIVLLAYRGESQQQDAMRGLAVIQTEWGLPDAYLDKRGNTTVVAFGRYQDPQSQEAQNDLRRVRALEAVIDGQSQRPFEFAFLTPPADVPGTIPEFDLRNAQQLHGKWALYTLQVGIYRREDGKPSSAADIAEFRRLAEDAVLRLRREGEPAFYYHGPTGSTVTIGLFGEEDFDPQIRLESPKLKALRERHPHNLLNGMGINRRVTLTDQRGRQVKSERLDPSMLVAVPRAR